MLMLVIMKLNHELVIVLRCVKPFKYIILDFYKDALDYWYEVIILCCIVVFWTNSIKNGGNHTDFWICVTSFFLIYNGKRTKSPTT